MKPLWVSEQSRGTSIHQSRKSHCGNINSNLISPFNSTINQSFEICFGDCFGFSIGTKYFSMWCILMYRYRFFCSNSIDNDIDKKIWSPMWIGKPMKEFCVVISLFQPQSCRLLLPASFLHLSNVLKFYS